MTLPMDSASRFETSEWTFEGERIPVIDTDAASWDWLTIRYRFRQTGW